MTRILERIIDVLGMQIKSYNEYCRFLLERECVFGKITLNLQNERTIAHFFDVHIQKELEKLLYSHSIISECSMKYVVAAKDKGKFGSEIKIRKNKKLKEYIESDHELYVPDTVIVDFGDLLPHLYCIEYKVDSHFSCCKLALDFLKYKYYSSGLACNSTFVYVLFYKATNRLEIKGSFELDEILDENTSYHDKSIFVFGGDNRKAEIEVSSKVVLLVEEAEKTIEIIERSSGFGADGAVGCGPIDSLENNVFYRNRKGLNSNVLIAEVIKENYSTIVKLANNITTKINIARYSSDGLYDLSPKNFSSFVFSEEDCINLKNYFNNQIKRILEEETRSIPPMYNYSKKKATWVLILLQRLAINNGGMRLLRNLKSI